MIDLSICEANRTYAVRCANKTEAICLVDEFQNRYPDIKIYHALSMINSAFERYGQDTAFSPHIDDDPPHLAFCSKQWYLNHGYAVWDYSHIDHRELQMTCECSDLDLFFLLEE